MPTIIINRTSEYLNLLMDFIIYIDENKVGTIANGKTRELKVSPGQHTMYVKVDWGSSQKLTFDVAEGDVKTFKIGGFKRSRLLLIMAGTIFFLGVVSRNEILNMVAYLLAIPGFIFLVYLLTMGRKKYLTLAETQMDRQKK